MANDTKDLIEAHEAMAAVLDARFHNIKEWTAFRAIDRALLSSLTKPATPTPPTEIARRFRERVRLHDEAAPTPYMTLAANALTETDKPITTAELMDYIGARRSIGGDPKRARIVVQSSMSKDERFKSIPWEGGRAWWWSDKPIPKKETAGG